MRVLVTGGAGYIGSICAAKLLEAGHEVTVLDDLSTGHERAVPEGASFERIDLVDRGAVLGALDRAFDGAIHFAARALVEESTRLPELYWRVNVAGTRNLLDALREGGVRRLVFSSTCAVYGHPQQVPIDEGAALAPVTPYGSSKQAVDRMISDESAAHGLGAASLRYFNVAGASGELGEDHRPETHLVPRVLDVAAGHQEACEVYGTDYDTPDGTAIRDYIHVEDLAEAHRLALEAVEPGRHAIFNLGNGAGASVREVVEAAREVTGAEIPTAEVERRPGDPAVLVAANDRISTELGWAPRKPELATMIADAWAWRRAHPRGYRD
jgi:UDP-glucose 4-epimerase